MPICIFRLPSLFPSACAVSSCVPGPPPLKLPTRHPSPTHHISGSAASPASASCLWCVLAPGPLSISVTRASAFTRLAALTLPLSSSSSCGSSGLARSTPLLILLPAAPYPALTLPSSSFSSGCSCRVVVPAGGWCCGQGGGRPSRWCEVQEYSRKWIPSPSQPCRSCTF